jgi:hypothetical protein
MKNPGAPNCATGAGRSATAILRLRRRQGYAAGCLGAATGSRSEIGRQRSSGCRRRSRSPIAARHSCRPSQSGWLFGAWFHGLHSRQPARRLFGRRRLWCTTPTVSPRRSSPLPRGSDNRCGVARRRVALTAVLGLRRSGAMAEATRERGFDTGPGSGHTHGCEPE